MRWLGAVLAGFLVLVLAGCEAPVQGKDLAGLSSEKELLTFWVSGDRARVDAVLDSSHTAYLVVDPDTDVKTIPTNFSVSAGARLRIGGRTLHQGDRVDYTEPVKFTVEAANGTTQDNEITIERRDPLANILSAFAFVSPASTAGIISDSVGLLVPQGTDLHAVVATFTVPPGAKVTVAGLLQQSGVTANDFSSDIVYTVTSRFGDERTYIVTVQTN